MKPALDQLASYAAYHRDRRNIATHAVGLPIIAFAVIVLLSRVGIPVTIGGMPFTLTPAIIGVIAACIYYLLLDLALGAALIAIIAAMTGYAGDIVALGALPSLAIGLGLLAAGLILQFIGHYYEGRRPAFLDDLISTLIGPLFVMAELFFLLGIKRDLQRDIEARAGPTVIREIGKKEGGMN